MARLPRVHRPRHGTRQRATARADRARADPALAHAPRRATVRAAATLNRPPHGSPPTPRSASARARSRSASMAAVRAAERRRRARRIAAAAARRPRSVPRACIARRRATALLRISRRGRAVIRRRQSRRRRAVRAVVVVAVDRSACCGRNCAFRSKRATERPETSTTRSPGASPERRPRWRRRSRRAPVAMASAAPGRARTRASSTRRWRVHLDPVDRAEDGGRRVRAQTALDGRRATVPMSCAPG